MNHISLNDKNKIPQLGYGVYLVKDNEAQSVVETAIETGYRSIDTASIYKNEDGVGDALKTYSDLRKDLFITTKLWNSDQGASTTLKAFEDSLKRLKLDYVDLYLIHWPAPKKGQFSASWKELIKIKESGRAKSIGVSNFQISHLEQIMNETGVIPTVNQIELHPEFQQRELKAFHAKHGIATEAWSPLAQGHLFENQSIKTLAAKYNKTPAQIILNWHMESGNIAIPKSVNTLRIQDNFNIFDFKLSSDDMNLMNSLDKDSGRVGPNPDTADF